MAEFPSFLTTGPTRDFQTVPLQHQPLNLGPLIQSLRQAPQAKGTKPKLPGQPDFSKVEGRIGAVNQYVEMANGAYNDMRSLVDLYGESAVLLPEYKHAARLFQDLTSSDRLNTIKRQTDDVNRFKEQTKGKGGYYHLGEWIRSGDLKKISTWQDIQERGYTSELGKEGDFVEDFDFDPVLFSMEDARVAADAIYDKHGLYRSAGGSETISQQIVGNMVGAMQNYNSWMNQSNYGNVDEEGNVVTLDRAHQQSLARALQGNIDVTDPLTAGYMQGFLQKTGGLDPYLNKEGILDEKGQSSLLSDFQSFVSEDLKDHFNKRKEKISESDQKLTFQEQDAFLYERGAMDEILTVLDGAWKQKTVSLDETINYGLPASDVIGALDSVEDNLLLSGDDAPFIINNVDGVDYLIPNEHVDYEALREKAKESYSDDGSGLSADEYANFVVQKAKERVDRVTIAMNEGRGTVGNTRQTVDENHMDALNVPTFWWDGVNSEDLVGQDAENFGTNVIGRIGESFINISDLGKDIKYNGATGGITMGSNSIPTNAGFVMADGTQYRIADPEFKALPQEQQLQIAKNAAYSGLMNHDGTPADAAEFAYPSSMNGFGQDFLARMATDPNSSLNVIFASPGALYQTAEYVAKDERTAAKALESVPIHVEMPSSYKSDTKYKEVFDKQFSGWENQGLNRILASKSKPGAVKFSVDGTGEQVAEMAGITGNAKRKFIEEYDKAPKGTPLWKLRDLVVTAKTKGLTNWNWNNRIVTKTKMPAAENGVINPYAKQQIAGTTNEKGEYVFRIPTNMTGAAMRGIKGDPQTTYLQTNFIKRANEKYTNSLLQDRQKNTQKNTNKFANY